MMRQILSFILSLFSPTLASVLNSVLCIQISTNHITILIQYNVVSKKKNNPVQRWDPARLIFRRNEISFFFSFIGCCHTRHGPLLPLSRHTIKIKAWKQHNVTSSFTFISSLEINKKSSNLAKENSWL